MTEEGSVALHELEQLLQEEDYMQSPYWGVFQYFPNNQILLKQKVSNKISQEMIEKITTLHKIINLILKDYLNTLISSSNNLEYQLIIELLQNDFTTKELILSECKKMIVYDQTESKKELINSKNKQSNEEMMDDENIQQTTAISNTTLSFYSQTWKISPYLQQAEKALQSLSSSNNNNK
ncbi:hypothetical protein ABK040_016736 [Willaertia magna]